MEKLVRLKEKMLRQGMLAPPPDPKQVFQDKLKEGFKALYEK